MSAPISYLDTSALIKRYIEEPGFPVVRRVFMEAYEGETKISFNVWNIGEFLSVIDRALRTRRLGKNQYRLIRRRFLGETKRMTKLGISIVTPIKVDLLKDTWRIIEEDHLYVADALQIAAAEHVGAEKFYTGDKRLHEAASGKGLKSILLQ